MKMIQISAILTAPLLMLAISLPSMADSALTPPARTCTDGTTSTAAGKGACSGHGGVQKASPGTAGAMTAPAKATPPASTTPSPPAGATAKCKDGTYSKSKGRSGACSKHGGVSDWLAAGN